MIKRLAWLFPVAALLAACGQSTAGTVTRTVTQTITIHPSARTVTVTAAASKSASSQTFSAGTYVVGKDIPAGTYRSGTYTSICGWSRMSSLTDRDRRHR